MKRLVSTTNLSKCEWLQYRKTGITGTDAGAITGLNPYSSAFQVYLDKTSDHIEEFDSERLRQGRDMEEYVARRFEEATGKKVHRANAIYQNDEHPIMLADFDRIITGEKAGLECKTVSPYSSDKWDDDSIPLHYQMQCQHYLAVSGFDCWYICALIFGEKLIIHKIERDEEIINNLITIEENFWNNHVLSHVMPNPDGSDSCNDAISKLYQNSDASKTIQLNGYDQILDRRLELDELIKKLEAEKASIDQQLKIELADATIGMTPKYKVSWSSYEQNRLDTKKLKSEKPDIYNEYCKTSSSRRFTVSHAA